LGPDGIYFEVVQKTYAHVFEVSPKRSGGKAGHAEHAVAFGFSFARDFKHAAFRAALENEYAQIYAATSRRGRRRN